MTVLLVQSFGASKQGAKNSFCTVYKEKTGNWWGNESMKKPGKFYPLDIDYGQEEVTNQLEDATSNSQLVPEVQKLVRLIFDVENMKNALVEFEVRIHSCRHVSIIYVYMWEHLCVHMCVYMFMYIFT